MPSCNSPLPSSASSRVSFFFATRPTPKTYTLSLHDALPIFLSDKAYAERELFRGRVRCRTSMPYSVRCPCRNRSEEHTSELQSLRHLVCRLLLEKKKYLDKTNAH